METQWDQPAEASAKPVCLLSLLYVLQTWLHPTGCPVEGQPGRGTVPQCQPGGARCRHHGMLAPSTITKSQVGPCWVCQLEGCPVGP